MPNVGDIAPEFELMTQDHSRKVKLSDLRGKTVVPLFYPMDFLPVCTTEHCSFTAAFGQIAPDKDTVVFGVSTYSSFAHAAFKKQFISVYDLLADPTAQNGESVRHVHGRRTLQLRQTRHGGGG